MPSTVNLSSKWTMFVKLIFPTMWAVFWIAPVVLVLASTPEDRQFNLSPLLIKFLFVSFYFSTLGFLYLFFMKLKRVEYDEEFLYVTNYFKMFRYTFDSIESIEISKPFIFQPVTVHFKDKGSFGKSVTFFASKSFVGFIGQFDGEVTKH